MTATKHITNQLAEHQKAILGSLIVNPANYYVVKDKVSGMMFSGILEDIAAFLFDRLEHQKNYDLPGIHSRFDSQIVSMLMDSVTGKDELTEHAQRLHDGYMAQKYSGLTREVMEQVEHGGSFAEALAEANEQMETLRSLFKTGVGRSEVFTSTKEEIIRARENEGLLGIPTGWADFDNYSSGLLPATYYGVAGRAGMGKTTVMCCMAAYQVEQGYNVVFFAMGDQNKQKIIKKIASISAGIPFGDIVGGELTDQQLEAISDKIDSLYESGLYVYDIKDVPSRKPHAVADKVYDLKRQGIEADVVYIDYLQQMEAPANQSYNGNARVGYVSRHLQAACTLMDIPFIAGSQMNRAVEQRGGAKRPQLSDLRDSGTLEQDFRMVIAPYRPEYYGILEDENGNSLKGLTELIVLKNDVRGGILPTFDLYWRNQRLEETL